MDPVQVVIETGKKRVFACALDWPGWARAGRSEASALEALLVYGGRYTPVAREAGVDFIAPSGLTGFVVTERMQGNVTTDFGAPDAISSGEYALPDSAELDRLGRLLQACWQAFDAAVRQAAGKTLQLGPRGGGRSLERIIEHVVGGQQGYLGSLAWKSAPTAAVASLPERLEHVRRETQLALQAAARSELPERRPRGGRPWPVRFFVRRSAWHVLDHAWELEDRIV